MASMRRYDVQARYGLNSSLAALVPLAAAAYVSWTHYKPTLRAIEYGEVGWFKIGFLGCVAAAALLSLTGMGLGFSSAGQRRNPDQAKSWLGFFIGGFVFALCIVALFAFKTLGVKVPVAA